MKISYADYIKKTDVSVLVAEAIFSNLEKKYPHKKISEVAETTSGGTPLRSNPDFYGGNIPWLKSGELKDGLIESAEEYITEIGLKNSSAKLLPENTLLLAMYGATAGRTGITKIKAATNQAICAIFPKSHINQEYLYWFLRQYRYNFIDISKGGAQPNISQSVINATKIPIPDVSLQKQISDILSQIEVNGTIDITILPFEFRDKVNKVFASKNKVEAISTELNHQLTLVKKLRQQLLQDAVQGKLTAEFRSSHPELVEGSYHASELLKKIKAEKQKLIAEGKLKKEKELPPIKAEEIPFDIPEDWVWCRLGEVVEMGRGRFSIRPRNDPSYFGGEYPFIQIGSLDENGSVIYKAPQTLNEKGFKVSKQFPKGTIAIAIVGGTIGNLGVLGVDMCFTDSMVGIQPSEFYIQDYILSFLRLKQPALKQASYQMAGQPNIKIPTLENLILPMPPLSEQHRIVQKLDELMQTCDALEASIKESAAQNEKLLQQVLREALRKSEG